ncbi:hypothetical protein V8E55_005914 [Tylopilus felleus]
MPQIVELILLAGVTAATIQQPISTPSFQDAETDGYQFSSPIQNVAHPDPPTLPCGGLVAYRELTEAGLDVRVFERDSVPGGNWHYTEEVPLDAPVPNAPCSVGDFVPSLLPEDVDLPHSEEFKNDGEIWRNHRGPKPIWESLTTNLPAPMQQVNEFSQWPWPVGTQWELSHYQVRNYVRSYASYLNINSNDQNPTVSYNTRVELVEKRINEAGQEQGWRLWLRSLEPTQNSTYRATWWTEDFDAVVVAVGRFNAPFMPSISGLEEWVRRYPDLIRHSRQYRRPDEYTNQTVLIVGASASGAEISRDLNPHVKNIYQSFRPDNHNATHLPLKNQLRRIPKNTTLVGEIKRFLPIPDGSPIQSSRESIGFLPQYYDGATYKPHTGSATTASPFLPLDGSYIRDLYLDQFYLRDPTLAFINVPLGILSFILSEYTTLAVAKVWTNKAKLPTSQTMRTLYEKTVEERGGYGKYLLFLGSKRTNARIAYLVGWLNEAAVKYGGKQVDGLPK